jgi:hypothetical protein
MVSCMLLSHGSQAVQTSRFSAARVPIDTCGMSYLRGFGNVVCNCNFVICTIKYTHTCALGRGFKLVSQISLESNTRTTQMLASFHFSREPPVSVSTFLINLKGPPILVQGFFNNLIDPLVWFRTFFSTIQDPWFLQGL